MATGTTFRPDKYSELGALNLLFDARGVKATASANNTTNIDMLVSDDSLITGVHLLVNNAAFGDKVTLQVVDKDNVLGLGAGTVLRQPATDWYIASDVQTQLAASSLYPAKIVAGLYLRVVYTSVALLTSPTVAINYHLHKVLY